MEFENKDLCQKCGGRCCKKSGCDYFVSDFEVINKNNLVKILDTGNVSIVAALSFKTLRNGEKAVEPFLYLRARNIDRGVVDLFSLKKTCSMLTDTGCTYTLENRPGGGVNLIPREDVCRPLKDPVEEIKKWLPYQSLLSKLVKRYTGKSVEENLKEDIKKVFYQFIMKDFDGVSEVEIEDMASCLPELASIYQDCYLDTKNKTTSLKRMKK